MSFEHTSCRAWLSGDVIKPILVGYLGSNFLFSNKPSLMIHIKREHRGIPCTKFIKNECDREEGSEDECWFLHVKSVGISPNKKKESNDTQGTTKESSIKFQGFRQSPLNLVPPTPPAINLEALIKSLQGKLQQTCSIMMKEFVEQMKANV